MKQMLKKLVRHEAENAAEIRRLKREARAQSRRRWVEDRKRWAENRRHDAQVWKMETEAKVRSLENQVKDLRHEATVRKLEKELELERRHLRINLFLGVVYDVLAVASFLSGAKKKRWVSHTAGFLLLLVSAFHFLMDFAERKAE